MSKHVEEIIEYIMDGEDFQYFDNHGSLVRCKDCKYWRNKDPEQIPTASIMCGHMHPDDFCSYGERRE